MPESPFVWGPGQETVADREPAKEHAPRAETRESSSRRSATSRSIKSLCAHANLGKLRPAAADRFSRCVHDADLRLAQNSSLDK